MKSPIRPLLAVSALVLGLAAWAPRSADACTSQCVRVDPNRPFCRVCTDVGTYTGITCGQTGPCGCFFTQNTCGLSRSSLAAPAPVPQTEVCAVQPTAAAEPLAAILAQGD